MNRLERQLLAVAMGVVTALAACGGSGDPVDVAFVRVTDLGLNAWPEGVYQARTAEAWQAVWAQQEASPLPLPPTPVVDFARDMVVGVSEGLGTSGCQSLRITRVTESGTELVVDYVRSSPRFDPAHLIGCAAVLVPLVDFVTTRQSDKPVRFARTQTEF